MRLFLVSALTVFCVTPAQAQTAQPTPAPAAVPPPQQVQPTTAAPTFQPQAPAQEAANQPPGAPTVAPAPAPPMGSTPYSPPGYAPYPTPGQPLQPGYIAYPPQAYAPARDTRPRFLPYRPGEPAPPGYRYEESVRQGPVIAGALTGGIPYLLGLLVASSESFSNKRGFLLIPGVGPWLTLLTRDSTCDADLPISECTEDAGARIVLSIDGLLQTGGAILVASGILNPKRRYLLDQQWGSLRLTPRFYRGGVGLGAIGQF